MKRPRPTKAELVARLPRAFRPRLTSSQVVDLNLAHATNLDEIAAGRADEAVLWQYVGGVLTWSHVATMLAAGRPEMAQQLDVATRLVERYGRTGRVRFDGPDYQLAKDGVDYMDQLASLVDKPTAIAAAELADVQINAMESRMMRRVLDPASGCRMMWFDRQNSDVVFGDRRRETLTVADGSHGKIGGTRTLTINPDVLLDFRALPYADGCFKLVAFDPPHLVRAGPKSWLAAKYGKLGKDWREDLRIGFSECFRVLECDGVLVFKWNETQVKLSEVLALTNHQPLFGNTSGRKAGTHWLVFMNSRPEPKP